MRPVVSTFSIAAVDAETGEVGVAVSSKFLGVGAVVPWARANAGAIASQARSNMSFGPKGLDLLASGLSAQETIERLIAEDEERDMRQLAVVDANGKAAAWTGNQCRPWAGHLLGDGYTCQGNTLAGPKVVEAMALTFEETEGPLPERLMAALHAGHQKGGDWRGVRAAGLYVAKPGGSYDGRLDRYIDFRVDDHPEPIAELGRLLSLRRLAFG
jgi:uncharacterized Ntn-hydrolase superfamily protein